MQCCDGQVGISCPRDAKVNDLGVAPAVHENIVRFQVSVNDALLVTMVYCITHTLKEPDAFFDTEVHLIGVVGDRPRGRNVFHRKEGLLARIALKCSSLIDLSNARMTQTRQCLHFELETPHGGRGGAFTLDDLEGDTPLGVVLGGLVDSAHASAANDADDAILADRLGWRF